MAVITLLTDFGLKDPYVGIMKGMILSLDPGAVIVDITHGVEPQDIREGAFIVEESWSFFPPGTIHVAVVDPTVGSARRPMAVSREGHLFVGPDNGFFSLLLSDEAEARLIENREVMAPVVSPTFHGRDVFAPAAARLSAGFPFAGLGPLIADPVRLANLAPSTEGGRLIGEVVRFDRFGNAITNITREVLREFTGGRPVTIEMAGLLFHGLDRSYHEGEYTCLVGSGGYLEVALFSGDLKGVRGLRKGERVTVTVTPP